MAVPIDSLLQFPGIKHAWRLAYEGMKTRETGLMRDERKKGIKTARKSSWTILMSPFGTRKRGS